jgi:hypothetical protein
MGERKGAPVSELNEWQKFIMNGGKIYSKDGSVINASAMFGDEVKKERQPAAQRMPKRVSLKQVMAIKSIRGNNNG